MKTQNNGVNNSLQHLSKTVYLTLIFLCFFGLGAFISGCQTEEITNLEFPEKSYPVVDMNSPDFSMYDVDISIFDSEMVIFERNGSQMIIATDLFRDSNGVLRYYEGLREIEEGTIISRGCGEDQCCRADCVCSAGNLNVVGVADLLLIIGNNGTTVAEGCSYGDMNGDAIISQGDINAFLPHYGTTCMGTCDSDANC